MAIGGGLTEQGGSDPASLAALHAAPARPLAAVRLHHRPAAPADPCRPAWLKAVEDWLGLGVRPPCAVLKILFWVGVAAAVLLVVWLIVREVAGARFAAATAGASGAAGSRRLASRRAQARALLENADRLAAIGRYDQAVRLILHRGVEDIDARRPRLVLRPALTARDIAALAAVPRSARTAFARIADIVEISAFAGQPIGQAAFGQCRAAYEAFAFPRQLGVSGLGVSGLGVPASRSAVRCRR